MSRLDLPVIVPVQAVHVAPHGDFGLHLLCGYTTPATLEGLLHDEGEGVVDQVLPGASELLQAVPNLGEQEPEELRGVLHARALEGDVNGAHDGLEVLDSLV